MFFLSVIVSITLQEFTFINSIENMITIWVNNEKHSVDFTSLSELIAHLGIDTQGVAVAVNQQIITRSLWKDFLLKENDNILIIRATQGG